MNTVSYLLNDENVLDNAIEEVDINRLDEVSGGILPAIAAIPLGIKVAGAGFALGATVTATLIAAKWG